MNKKLLCIATLCAAVTANAFADTQKANNDTESKDVIRVSANESEIFYNNTVYVPASNNKFFVSIELPLLSYVGSTLSIDGDSALEETEIKLNNGALGNSALRFGFSLRDAVRIGFDIAHYSAETDYKGYSDGNSEYSVGTYGVALDAILFKDAKLSPFVRLGIGYVDVEEDYFELSSTMFRIGMGVNYNITENLFSYGVLEYSIVPETDIKDTDAQIEANMFSILFGVGYKF